MIHNRIISTSWQDPVSGPPTPEQLRSPRATDPSNTKHTISQVSHHTHLLHQQVAGTPNGLEQLRLCRTDPLVCVDAAEHEALVHLGHDESKRDRTIARARVES